MKKIAAFLLALMLLCAHCCALAENPVDFSALSDVELLKLMNLCHSELADRETQQDEILYEDKELGITVKITGLEVDSWGPSVSLMGTLINRSEYKVSVCVKSYEVFANNWSVGCYGNRTLDAEPGRNTKAEIFKTTSMKDKTDITKPADLATLEGTIVVYVDGKAVKEIPFTYTQFPAAK